MQNSEADAKRRYMQSPKETRLKVVESMRRTADQ